MNNWCKNTFSTFYARFDAKWKDGTKKTWQHGRWRCFKALTKTEELACVSETGELTRCPSGDRSDTHWTRDFQLRHLIVEGCPATAVATGNPQYIFILYNTVQI